jgi:disulfide bond formation protein DsbB
VLCNEAPMRILGLSFAGWNAVASVVIAALCFSAARQKA